MTRKQHEEFAYTFWIERQRKGISGNPVKDWYAAEKISNFIEEEFSRFKILSYCEPISQNMLDGSYRLLLELWIRLQE